MSEKNRRAIIEGANRQSATLIGSLAPTAIMKRENCARLVAVCRDLVAAKPSQEPTSMRVTELGKARYGRFPAERTIYNHYRELLAIWRQAYRSSVSAIARVHTESSGNGVIPRDVTDGFNSSQRAWIQVTEALIKELNSENIRLKKIIRDNVPVSSQGRSQELGFAATSSFAAPVQKWLQILDAGGTQLEVAAAGLKTTRLTRFGTIIMGADVLEALRSCFLGQKAQ